MEDATKVIPDGINIKAVNMRSLYLKVIVLFDITQLYGYRIDIQVLNGMRLSKIIKCVNDQYRKKFTG